MSVHRIYAHLGLDGDNVPIMLERGVIVHDAFVAHAAELSSPPLPTCILKVQIGNLESAQHLVTTRMPNSAPSRNTARTSLRNSLELYRAYLQLVADASSDPASVIAWGGMRAVELSRAPKPVLDARLDAQGVMLCAHAKLLHKGRGGRFFNWQYTIDGGKTWIAVPSTPGARTVVTGLPSLTTCGFRVSVTHSGGQTEWSQAVSLFVL